MGCHDSRVTISLHPAVSIAANASDAKIAVLAGDGATSWDIAFSARRHRSLSGAARVAWNGSYWRYETSFIATSSASYGSTSRNATYVARDGSTSRNATWYGCSARSLELQLCTYWVASYRCESREEKEER